MMNNGILNFLTSLMNQSDLPKLICLTISTHQKKSILLFNGNIFKTFYLFVTGTHSLIALYIFDPMVIGN